MPSFSYRARDGRGRQVSGNIEAASAEAAAEQVIALGYVPVEIKARGRGAEKRAPTASWKLRFGGVKQEELVYFSRQLALVLSAGVPLLRSLQVMAAQTTNERLRDALSNVAAAIEGGVSLSEAMAAQPHIFSPLYTSMVRAGEASGTLDASLNKLAELGEFELVTRARFQAATRYPKMVAAALVIAFFVVVYFVIPNFAKLFAELQADLPLPTRMMLRFNDLIQSYWLVSIIALAAAAAIFFWWVNTAPGRYWLDKVKVTVPIFGPLVAKFVLSRFSRVFATLNASGLPILTTLALATETIGNTYYARYLAEVSERVKGGQDLAGSLARAGIFPGLLVQMVAVGETSGSLDEVLDKVSQYYDQDVDYAIKRLSGFLEPMLLALLASFVGFMALAVFLPMWNLATVMTR